MRNIIKILVLVILFPLTAKTQDYETILYSAYRSNDTIKLNNFLDKWNTDIESDNISNIHNDTIIAIYKLFKNFHNSPKEYCKTVKSHDLPNKWWSDYIMIQKSVYYETTNAYSNIEFARKIKCCEESIVVTESKLIDFKPLIKNKNRKVLYLTKEYYEAIDNFVGLPKFRTYFENTEANRSIFDTCYAKKRFLEKSLVLIDSHWWGFSIASHPIVNKIVFDKKLKKATLHYRIFYRGGEVKYFRILGIWIKIRQKLTWIE